MAPSGPPSQAGRCRQSRWRWTSRPRPGPVGRPPPPAPTAPPPTTSTCRWTGWSPTGRLEPSDLDVDDAPFDPDPVARHRFGGRALHHLAGGHVELRAVARARDRGALELA